MYRFDQQFYHSVKNKNDIRFASINYHLLITLHCQFNNEILHVLISSF